MHVIYPLNDLQVINPCQIMHIINPLQSMYVINPLGNLIFLPFIRTEYVFMFSYALK